MMKKLKLTLLTGALVASLGSAGVFAATAADTTTPDSRPQPPAYGEPAPQGPCPCLNAETCPPNAQGSQEKGNRHHKMSPEKMDAKILAGLTDKDTATILQESREQHKPIAELAKDAGVYEKFITERNSLIKNHLDKAVAAGKITQEQADKMFQDMKDGKRPPMGPDREKQFPGHGQGMAMHQQSAQILADLTGRTTEDILNEARTERKSIPTIAEEAGVYDKFMPKYLESVQSNLTQAVSDGRLTQEQADKIFQNIKDGKHTPMENHRQVPPAPSQPRE